MRLDGSSRLKLRFSSTRAWVRKLIYVPRASDAVCITSGDDGRVSFFLPFLTERQIYSASSRIIPLQSVPRSKDSARAAQPSPDADPFGSVRFGSGSDMVAVGCLKVRWGEKRSLCNNKQGLFVRAMSLFSMILLYLRDLSCSSRFFFVLVFLFC